MIHYVSNTDYTVNISVYACLHVCVCVQLHFISVESPQYLSKGTQTKELLCNLSNLTKHCVAQCVAVSSLVRPGELHQFYTAKQFTGLQYM